MNTSIGSFEKGMNLLEMGRGLCSNFKRIAVGLGGLKYALNHGTTAYCAGVTILKGVTDIYNGSMVSGLTSLTCGGVELLSTFKSGNHHVLGELLKDACGTIETIKDLNQENLKSYDKINNRLLSKFIASAPGCELLR